jgi:FkbM family methyltransferase
MNRSDAVCPPSSQLEFVRTKIARILKKLKNLPRGRQSMASLLDEARAMRVSYSQFGEDLVVRTHFAVNFDNSIGRFIDVGAFHPFKYSNTMLLSQLGWRGINVDCDPVKIARFQRLRPQDENICAAVAEKPGDMVYLEYSAEGLTNRIADAGEKDLLSGIGEKPLRVTPIKVTTLSEIVEQSVFRGQHFHYLNVDCEGQDLSVLKGLDFSRYSPELISVEAFTKTLRPQLTAFLAGVGYELTDMVHLTLFFQKQSSVNDS